MKTIVRCSFPGCDEIAVTKVAAPWRGGSNAELKTYGYACPVHAEDVVTDAADHATEYRLAAGEFVGKFSTFPLASAETMAHNLVLASR